MILRMATSRVNVSAFERKWHMSQDGWPRARTLTPTFTLVLTLVSVADGEPKAMTDKLAAEPGVVRQGRIMFSHHSAGVNILAGRERLDEGSTGTRMRIASLDEAAALEGARAGARRGSAAR